MAGDEGENGLQHLPDDFLDDLDAASSAPPPTQGAEATARLDDLALSAILRSQDAHGGNVSAAARALGISRNTIYRKLPRA